MSDIVISLCSFSIVMILWHIAACIEELSREIREQSKEHKK